MLNGLKCTDAKSLEKMEKHLKTVCNRTKKKLYSSRTEVSENELNYKLEESHIEIILLKSRAKELDSRFHLKFHLPNTLVDCERNERLIRSEGG